MSLNRDQKKKAIKYWLNSAEYDLEVSDSLFEKKKYHYSLFFGHLSLEKLLKAIFIKYKSEHAPITHSLPYLCEKSGLEIDTEKLEKLAEFMEFYIGGRYPKDLEEILKKYNKSFTLTKLKEVKEIFSWLKKKLEK